MRARLLVFLITTTCIGHTTSAQMPSSEDNIRISGIEVSLGMPRDAVYQRFKDAHVKLKELHFPDRKAADEEWKILANCAPGPDGNDECDTIGQVRFTNQKVTFALTRWGTGAQSASDVAQALYGAVQDFSRRGLGQCGLDTQDYSDPEHHFQRIVMQCGPHAYITLTMIKKTTESTRIDIAEMISEAQLSAASQ
jgi:hypothetical protein